MSSKLSAHFKITVKLTMRVPIKPTENLLTLDLGVVYHTCTSKLDGKKLNEKRFSTKLRALANCLQLSSGSWWHFGPAVLALPYSCILQFSFCPDSPAKVLLLITNNDHSRTELVAIKTKGNNFANQILTHLQKAVPMAQNGLSANAVTPTSTNPLPVSYQEGKCASSPAGPETSNHSVSPSVPSRLEGRPRRQPPVPPVNHAAVTPPVRSRTPKRSQGLRVEPLEPSEYPNRPIRAKHSSEVIQCQNYSPSRPIEQPQPLNGHHAPKAGTLDSTIYYDQLPTGNFKRNEELKKQKKPKSRAPRELSTLSAGRKVSRELDENNIPWEVNICYIKHDPLVGCVEDESGPIYMYTAHQLVPTDDRDYDGTESEDSEDTNSDEYNYSEDESDFGSGDSSDENKKLEKFMLVGRDIQEGNHCGVMTTNTGLNAFSN